MKDYRRLPPLELTAKARELLALACPDKDAEPFFNRCMGQAKGMGLTWIEGLQFTAAKRRELN